MFSSVPRLPTVQVPRPVVSYRSPCPYVGVKDEDQEDNKVNNSSLFRRGHWPCTNSLNEKKKKNGDSEVKNVVKVQVPPVPRSTLNDSPHRSSLFIIPVKEGVIILPESNDGRDDTTTSYTSLSVFTTLLTTVLSCLVVVFLFTHLLYTFYENMGLPFFRYSILFNVRRPPTEWQDYFLFCKTSLPFLSYLIVSLRVLLLLLKSKTNLTCISLDLLSEGHYGLFGV